MGDKYVKKQWRLLIACFFNRTVTRRKLRVNLRIHSFKFLRNCGPDIFTFKAQAFSSARSCRGTFFKHCSFLVRPAWMWSLGVFHQFAGFRKVFGGDLYHEAHLTSGLQELVFSDYLEFVLFFVCVFVPVITKIAEISPSVFCGLLYCFSLG